MIVYKVTNTINNKSYIGQTINDLKQRKNEHISGSYKSYFHNSIHKHGIDCFVWEVLCECSSKVELDEMEFHYIKQYDTKAPNGYNLTWGGDGVHGYKHTPSHKNKISKKYTNNGNPFYGKIHSDNTKEKISKTCKGLNTGNKNGSKQSEARKLISLSRQGKITYIFTSPTGIYYKTKHFSKFCNNRKLNEGCMRKVANGNRKDHKGWKMIRSING